MNYGFDGIDFGLTPEIIHYCEDIEKSLAGKFSETDRISEYNQYKVLRAMRDNKLSDTHFSQTSGYGYNDAGRDVIEKIYAGVFSSEAALVRPQIISGTHALSLALFGNLRQGDELLSPCGAPYDTLCGVIGIRPEKGSLAEQGVVYRQADLTDDGYFDYRSVQDLITPRTRLVTIQRSKGYAWRRSLTVGEIGELINFIKDIDKNIICMVDNCYGEFVERIEPGDVGADLTVGSLIKNPGGGLAATGGYIAGRAEYVENAAIRLTAPGLGGEIGPMLGATRSIAQGLFMAPQIVNGALKGAMFASAVFGGLGYDVCPKPDEIRSDIVQAIRMNSENEVVKFCQSIQKSSPVDSFVVPVPWAMPGYDCGVIMASGAFVQGSSIELSADAPVKPPYTVFLQGGLTWFHAKYAVLSALKDMGTVI